jgi:hypothetical protein
MAVALAVGWGWLSIDAARAWGRDGFHVRMAIRWRLAEPDWPDQRLTPEMAARWRRTIEEDRHAFAWAYPDAPWP